MVAEEHLVVVEEDEEVDEAVQSLVSEEVPKSSLYAPPSSQ